MIDLDSSTSIEAFFLTGHTGQLFSIFYSPEAVLQPTAAFLYVPPFADEMNKSRHQAALQARHLAARGFATLIVDLYGTGDSEGHFRDARWDMWIEDLLVGIQWLQDRGINRLFLWGVRLGALLAVDLSQRLNCELERIVLWQPVVSGKLFINQFLRLRAAAEMMTGDGGLNTGELQAELKRNGKIEVAGYELAAEMASEIEIRDLRKTQVVNCANIDLLEIVPDSVQAPAPVVQQVIMKWQAAGMNVRADTVIGEPFWIAPETTVVGALFEKSSQMIGCVNDTCD